MKIEAEARVGGILRGGHIDTSHKTFTYHAPHKMTVPIRECTEVKLLNKDGALVFVLDKTANIWYDGETGRGGTR